MGITGETTMNRRDYGVNYGLDAVISDEISIVLQIEAPMPRPAPPPGSTKDRIADECQNFG